MLTIFIPFCFFNTKALPSFYRNQTGTHVRKIKISVKKNLGDTPFGVPPRFSLLLKVLHLDSKN
jgi:hypothetical protein